MKSIDIKNVPDAQRRVLHERELADRWGMAVTTLQKWRQISFGPRFMKLSSRVAYPIESVEEFERNSLRKSTSERA